MKIKQAIAQAFLTIYRPASNERIHEWAEKNVILPSKESSENAGRYELRKAPYQIWFFEKYQQTESLEMICTKSSRAGITLAVYVAYLWAIKNRAKNILHVLDEEKAATIESTERLQPLLVESGIVPADKKFTNLLLSFYNMLIYFVTAGAKGAFDRKEVDWVGLDEMRNYSIQNAIAQARQRLKNKKSTKLCAFSEPDTEESEHWQEYLTSSQEEILLHCPHCGHEQALQFDRLIFSHCKREDGSYDEQALLSSTYYQCSGEKQCHIHEHERALMWRRWLSEMRSFTRVRNAGHSFRKYGIQITDLHSLFVPFSTTALAWIEAQGDAEKRKKLDTAVFAKVPASTFGEISDAVILSLCDSSYQQWECPFSSDDVSLVVQVIDTQDKTFKTTVVVYNRRHSFALTAWTELESLEECRLWAEDKPIRCTDGEVVTRFAGFVDEGDGNRQAEVHAFCAEYAGEGWQAIRGLGRAQTQGALKEKEYDVQGYVSPIVVLQIHEQQFKYDLVYNNFLKHSRNQRLNRPVIHLPATIDDTLLLELKNEYRRKDKRTKEMKWHKAGPNDYMDCIKYSKAGFFYLRPLLIEEGVLDDISIKVTSDSGDHSPEPALDT